ncbi:MAG: hypothetical protein Q7R88_02250, partial [bacterium]|nr:hypothetical protein [bacterium]
LSLLLGGLWAYSQQFFTGRTIWPYHFVQYTIPLAMVALFVLLYNTVRGWNRHMWGLLAAFAALSSVAFGIYTQASTYASARPVYAALQSRALLFDFLNVQVKDCVVLVDESSEEMSRLNTLIPAFTHCNVYSSTELFALIAPDRGFYNYAARLRLRGITPNSIDSYLSAHERQAAGYLYSNWQGLFGVKDFPDFTDALLPERLAAFPKEYRDYAAGDFKAQLGRYRLDYILSDGPLLPQVARELPQLQKIFDKDGIILYSI